MEGLLAKRGTNKSVGCNIMPFSQSIYYSVLAPGNMAKQSIS